MKLVLKTLLVLALFALPWVGYCAPPPPAKSNLDASVRAALALAQAGQRRPAPAPVPKPQPKEIPNCGCDGLDCRCEAGKCVCKSGDRCTIDCDCKRKKDLSLSAAIDRAVAENRPLLIWIRQVCVPCQKAMPDCLHVHVTEYQGERDLVQDCSVIVGRPDGRGGLTRVATIPGCPDDLKQQVQAALAPPRPVFFAPPPPMFFGGFRCGGGG